MIDWLIDWLTNWINNQKSWYDLQSRNPQPMSSMVMECDMTEPNQINWPTNNWSAVLMKKSGWVCVCLQFSLQWLKGSVLSSACSIFYFLICCVLPVLRTVGFYHDVHYYLWFVRLCCCSSFFFLPYVSAFIFSISFGAQKKIWYELWIVVGLIPTFTSCIPCKLFVTLPHLRCTINHISQLTAPNEEKISYQDTM